MEGSITSRAFQQIAPSHTQQVPSQQHFLASSDVASLQRQVERISQEGQFLGVQSNDVQQITVHENEKSLVYRHPLFPLLGTIFDKCEIATSSLDTVNSQTFDQEIKSFIMQQAKEGKPFFTDDADTDQLMLKALQVLRIHLLEMEKVNELCKDFCSRYIACLKGKMNSENLMRTLNIHSVSPPPDDFLSSNSPMASSPQPQTQTSFETPMNQFNNTRQVNMPATQSPSEEVTNPLPVNSTASTPLSADVLDNELLPSPASPSEDLTKNTDLEKKKHNSKRGIFPKHATNIMKTWLFQHLVHPYPTEDEKRQIATQTNLTILQVNNWFINARRRILQPMLDNNTSYASLSRAKKIKPQKIPAQRAWPETIGVYSPYHSADGIQYHTTTGAIPAGYTVVSPGIAPQGSMIVNVATPNSHQPITIGSQQVQFMQVSTVPTVVQALPSGLIPVAPAGQVTNATQGQAIAVATHDIQDHNESKTPATTFRIVETTSSGINNVKSDSRETAVG